MGNTLCESCIQNLPKPENDLPENIYALFEYRNKIIKKILTDAKYRHKFSVLNIFGKYLSDAILDITNEYTELNNYRKIYLIPVPISKKHFKQRGFNQAEVIAKSVMSYCPIKLTLSTDIIKKVVETQSQASIKSRNERLLNPKNTFRVVQGQNLENSLCIIVDDITTTGGTINEIKRVLLENGAKRVVGITIAH